MDKHTIHSGACPAWDSRSWLRVPMPKLDRDRRITDRWVLCETSQTSRANEGFAEWHPTQCARMHKPVSRFPSVHYSTRSPAHVLHPKKSFLKRHASAGRRPWVEKRTKVDGYGHAALVWRRSVPGHDSVGHGMCDGRGRRRMSGWYVDGTWLVQRRRCMTVVRRGQHGLADANWGRRRGRRLTPLRDWTMVMVGLKGGGRRGWTGGRGEQRRLFINLRCGLGPRLLLNDASSTRLGSVGVLVVLLNRITTTPHGGQRGERRQEATSAVGACGTKMAVLV